MRTRSRRRYGTAGEDGLESSARMTVDELHDLIDSTGLAVVLLDRDARVRYSTPAARVLLDLPSGDEGTPLTDVAHRFAGVDLGRDVSAVLEGGETVEREVTTVDGGHHRLRVAPRRTAQGVTGAVVTLVYIGRYARPAPARSAPEETYRVLFDTIDEGFCLMQMIFADDGRPVDFRFVETNKVFERMTGLRDALGKTALELVPDLERRWIETYGEVARTGRSARFEDFSVPMGRHFDAYASAVGSGGLVALVFRDVTERRRLQSNQALLVSLNDDLHWLARPEEIITTLGSRLGKHLGLNALLFVDVDDRADEGVVNHAWVAGRRDYRGSYRITGYMSDAFRDAQRAGDLVVIRDAANDPLAQAGPLGQLGFGALLCVPYLQDGVWMASVVMTSAEPRDWRPDEVAVARDVADRLSPRIARARAEAALVSLNEKLEDEAEARAAALVRSRTRFQSAFDAGPTASVLTTLDDDRFMEVNAAFTEMTGYEPGEVKGRRAAELGMWSSEEDRQRIADAARGGTGYRHVEASLRTKQGGHLRVLLSAERVAMDDQEAWLKMFLDVTERHRTQEALMRSIESVMTDADWLGREVVERLSRLSGGAPQRGLEVLSPREREVLGHLAAGASDHEIAAALGVTRKTVSNHVANLYGKIGAHSRIEAAMWARERGVGVDGRQDEAGRFRHDGVGRD